MVKTLTLDMGGCREWTPLCHLNRACKMFVTGVKMVVKESLLRNVDREVRGSR